MKSWKSPCNENGSDKFYTADKWHALYQLLSSLLRVFGLGWNFHAEIGFATLKISLSDNDLLLSSPAETLHISSEIIYKFEPAGHFPAGQVVEVQRQFLNAIELYTFCS